MKFHNPFIGLWNFQASKIWCQPWPPKKMKWPSQKDEGFRVPSRSMSPLEPHLDFFPLYLQQWQMHNNHRTTLPSAFFFGLQLPRHSLSSWARDLSHREMDKNAWPMESFDEGLMGSFQYDDNDSLFLNKTTTTITTMTMKATTTAAMTTITTAITQTI